MKLLILGLITLALILIITGSLFCQPGVSWSPTSYGCGIGYTTFKYDPVAGGMLMPCKNGSDIGIFVTGVNEYCIVAGPSWCTGGAGHAVSIEDTGSTVDTCPVDLPASYGGANPNSLPNRMGDRHLVGQMAVDPNRNVAYFGGGINRCQYSNSGGLTVSGTALTQNTSTGNFAVDGSWTGARVYIQGSTLCGTSAAFTTIASVTDSGHATLAASCGTVSGNYTMYFVDTFQNAANNIWNDMYCLALNANPLLDTFTRFLGPGGSGLATPMTLSGGGFYYQGTFSFDKDDDVLYAFEGSHIWTYYPTNASGCGAQSGTLSAAQTAAGAATADNWTVASTTAPFNVYPGVVYDPNTKLFYVFGGSTQTAQTMYAYNPGGASRSTGTVSVASHTAVQLCTAGCTNPAAEYAGGLQTEYSAIDVDTFRHTILYHRTATAGVSGAADMEFNPAGGTTGTWTTLTSLVAGDSNTNGTQMQYAPTQNKLVTSGQGGTFQATLGSGSVMTGVTISGSVVVQ